MRVSKLFLVAAVTCAAYMAFAGSAVGLLKVDRTFGGGGVVRPQAADPAIGSILQMALAPRGAIYLLACDSSCSQGARVVRLRSDGSIDSAFGSGTGTLALGPAQATKIATDPDGRLLVASSDGGTVVVRRFDAAGQPTQSFGSAGAVTLECGCAGELILEPAGAGRILVGRESSVDVYPPGEGTVNRVEFHLWRLQEDGSLDAGYGSGGSGQVNIDHAYGESIFSKVSYTRVNGQTLLTGVNDTKGIYVHRLAANGADDEAFAARTARAMAGLQPAAGRVPSFVTSIIPRAKGAFDVIGSTDSFVTFILRFDKSGRLDRDFGKRGMRLLPYSVRSAALGKRGRVIAVANAQREDGSLLFWLRRDGSIERTGGTARIVHLRKWEASQSTVGVQRGVRPIVFTKGFEFCRYVCGADPKLIRFVG